MEELDCEGLEDFFSRKGAIQVLVRIGSGPRRFSDIERWVGVSSATVTNRLQEGDDLGLWNTEEVESSGNGRGTEYVLSELGEEIWRKARDLDLPHFTEKVMAIEEERDQRAEKLRDWLSSDSN